MRSPSVSSPKLCADARADGAVGEGGPSLSRASGVEREAREPTLDMSVLRTCDRRGWAASRAALRLRARRWQRMYAATARLSGEASAAMRSSHSRLLNSLASARRKNSSAVSVALRARSRKDGGGGGGGGGEWTGETSGGAGGALGGGAGTPHANVCSAERPNSPPLARSAPSM